MRYCWLTQCRPPGQADNYRRFEKVGNLLHTLFSLLLCFVDMRLGLGESFFQTPYRRCAPIPRSHRTLAPNVPVSLMY